MNTSYLLKRHLLLAFLISVSYTLLGQSGTVEADNGIILGNNSGVVNGTIRYTGSDVEARVSGSWVSLLGGGSSSFWTESGSDIYRLNGLVGMGTSSPDAKLHIKTTTQEGLRIQATTLPKLAFHNSANTALAYMQYELGNNQLRIANLLSGPIIFNTNGTEKLRIDAVGNVGIGSNLPQSRLEIVDNSDGSSASVSLIESENNDFARLFFENSNNATDKWSLAGNLGTTVDHRVGFYYNGNARVVYNEMDQGLGIGTASPSQKLHIKGAGNDGIRIDGDGVGDARIWLTNTGGSNFIFDDASDDNTLSFQSANEMAFYTNGGNERMRIAELAGEIGVNVAPNTNFRFRVNATNDLYCLAGETTSQQAVRGINSSVGSGVAYAIYGNVGSGPTGNKYGVYGFVSSAATGNSKYGVYGSSDASDPNSWGVYSNGDFWYTGTLSAPSDRRLKKNIENLQPVLNKVMQLETKTYEFDREKYDFANLADGKQIGFMAQNIESIFPSLVSSNTHSFVTNEGEEGVEPTTEELEILGINSIGMIPVLTKAMQEQQKMIETQQLQIEELKQIVLDLKNE